MISSFLRRCAREWSIGSSARYSSPVSKQSVCSSSSSAEPRRTHESTYADLTPLIRSSHTSAVASLSSAPSDARPPPIDAVADLRRIRR